MFVTRDEFMARVEQLGFHEWVEFLGNLYGTPVPDERVRADRDVLLEIEVEGAHKIKQADPAALCIFVQPPSREEQERRLRGRGDPEDVVQRRLAKAAEEADGAKDLDAIEVVNDDLERCVEEIASIIQRARG
ncbi:MAG: gmk [Actinomycetia bacterium]|nr:gmk [Actinomycetes bacterium]